MKTLLLMPFLLPCLVHACVTERIYTDCEVLKPDIYGKVHCTGKPYLKEYGDLLLWQHGSNWVSSSKAIFIMGDQWVKERRELIDFCEGE